MTCRGVPPGFIQRRGQTFHSTSTTKGYFHPRAHLNGDGWWGLISPYDNLGGPYLPDHVVIKGHWDVVTGCLIHVAPVGALP